MSDFIIDNDQAYNDFNSMIKSGEAKLLSMDNNVAKIVVNKKVIKVELEEKYIKKSDDLDDIIYGKDKTTSIVNISVKDNKVYIFTENEAKVNCHIKDYKQWVLSPRYQEGFTQLKGGQYYRFIKEYTDINNFNKIKDNLYKMGLYTVRNPVEAFMIRHGFTYFKGMKVGDISLLSFDIETTGLNANASDAAILLITNAYRKNGKIEKKTFNIEDYDTQKDMLIAWMNWIDQKDPSAIIGHNIILFDLPYIKAIADKLNIPLILGRQNNEVEFSEKTKELRVDRTQSYTYHPVTIFGREVIDTFFLAIKADIAKKYTSYGLKNIIKQEGLEKEGRQHYDASKIKQNWVNPEERAKIIQYGEDDADDPIKLFDIMVAPFFYLTPHIPKPFQNMIESATGSQLNSLMVRSYLQHNYSISKADDIESFEGAISFGCPGIYDNVFKVDVASLYPSIMRYYKIYPKTKDFNGNFLKALEYFTKERLKNKKLAKDTGDRYYKDLEQAQKVVINSAYGFMGASGLNYNYGEGAAEVTRHGREIITKAVEWATGHTLKKVVSNIINQGKENEKYEYEWVIGDKVGVGKGYIISNCDTDSISFTTGKELSDEERKELLIDLNSKFPSAIRFEDDGFFKRLIVLKAKNYILFDGKKIKLKGSSLKDQKKEPALRELLDTMIDSLIFNKNNTVDVYEKYIRECLHVSDIKRWAAKKTITKAILNCKGYTEQDILDKTIRRNETVVWDAIKNIKVQEGDKVYLYPAILSETIETITQKNGKVKKKRIVETGLKLVEDWTKDHDQDKLIERVYTTLEILSSVLPMERFIDYSLVKNKVLLDKFL